MTALLCCQQCCKLGGFLELSFTLVLVVIVMHNILCLELTRVLKSTQHVFELGRPWIYAAQ